MGKKFAKYYTTLIAHIKQHHPLLVEDVDQIFSFLQKDVDAKTLNDAIQWMQKQSLDWKKECISFLFSTVSKPSLRDYVEWHTDSESPVDQVLTQLTQTSESLLFAHELFESMYDVTFDDIITIESQAINVQREFDSGQRTFYRIPTWYRCLYEKLFSNPDYARIVKSGIFIHHLLLNNSEPYLPYFSLAETIKAQDMVALIIASFKCDDPRIKKESVLSWWSDRYPEWIHERCHGNTDASIWGKTTHNLDACLKLCTFIDDAVIRRQIVEASLSCMEPYTEGWLAHTGSQMYMLCNDQDPYIKACALAYIYKHQDQLENCIWLDFNQRIDSVDASTILHFLPEIGTTFQPLVDSGLISDVPSFLMQWARDYSNPEHVSLEAIDHTAFVD